MQIAKLQIKIQKATVRVKFVVDLVDFWWFFLVF